MKTYTLKQIAEITKIQYNTIKQEMDYEKSRPNKRHPNAHKCENCGSGFWLLGEESLDYFMRVAKKRGLMQ